MGLECNLSVITTHRRALRAVTIEQSSRLTIQATGIKYVYIPLLCLKTESKMRKVPEVPEFHCGSARTVYLYKNEVAELKEYGYGVISAGIRAGLALLNAQSEPARAAAKEATQALLTERQQAQRLQRRTRAKEAAALKSRCDQWAALLELGLNPRLEDMVAIPDPRFADIPN